MSPLPFTVDRDAKASLSSQIYTGLRDAIHQGTLAHGARLPSWRDLAVQLGVSRGTVRVVYERLLDEQLLISRGAGGTWVSEAPIAPPAVAGAVDQPPFPDFSAGLRRSSLRRSRWACPRRTPSRSSSGPA